MDTIQECFGWIASCLNICFYLTPVVPFINVLKGKLNFEDTPGVYVTCCYVNCFIWFIYGDMIFSDQVKYSNMISAGICLMLIIIYLAFELRKYFIDSILNTLILITGSWAVYRALTIVIDDDRVVGDICIGTTVIVFLSPIQIMYKVFKEKNYNLIPVFSNSFKSLENIKNNKVYELLFPKVIFTVNGEGILGTGIRFFGKEIDIKISYGKDYKNRITAHIGLLNSNKDLMKYIENCLEAKIKKMVLNHKEINLNEIRSIASFGVYSDCNCFVDI